MTTLADAVEQAWRRRDGRPAGDLAARLYAEWYARPLAPPDPAADSLPQDLRGLLRAAHCDAGRWEAGWSVDQVGGDGGVVAHRAGEVRWLHRVDHVVDGRPGTVAEVGDEIVACARRDRTDRTQPWWYTHSPGWSLDRPPPDLVRLYWHVHLDALGPLVRALTQRLVRSGRPWMLKGAVDVTHHGRADAVVVYLSRSDLESLAPAIAQVAAALAGSARSAGPPLTLPVAPGLAAAVDPGGGESFGEHRCRLVAEAVTEVTAAPTPGQDRAGALARVVERLRVRGLDPAHPHRLATDASLPWEG